MAVANRTLGQPRRRAPDASLQIGPVVIVAFVAITIVAVLQLAQTSGATTTNFSIQRLEQTKVEVGTVVRQLETDVAKLSSLSRIEQEARERLGLVQPRAQQTIQVNASWPAANQSQLPTRFAPDEQAAVNGEDIAWWQDLLQLLPFN